MEREGSVGRLKEGLVDHVGCRYNIPREEALLPEEDSLVDFFDTFFDEGFKVVSIEKNELESLKTIDILKINL